MPVRNPAEAEKLGAMAILRRILLFALVAFSLWAGALVLVASQGPLLSPFLGFGWFLIVVAMAILIAMRIGFMVGPSLLKSAGVAVWSYWIGSIFFLEIHDLFTPAPKTDEFSGLGAALSTDLRVAPLVGGITGLFWGALFLYTYWRESKSRTS